MAGSRCAATYGGCGRPGGLFLTVPTACQMGGRGTFVGEGFRRCRCGERLLVWSGPLGQLVGKGRGERDTSERAVRRSVEG